MTITLNGTTGITTPASTVGGSAVLTTASSLASANLTGALPAIDGSALTDLTSANLTGALPAIDGSALTGVGGSTDYGAVGTYVFGYIGNTSIVQNSTYAGSVLFPAGVWNPNVSLADDAEAAYLTRGATALSGTWRAMGRWNYASGSNRTRISLFVRTV